MATLYQGFDISDYPGTQTMQDIYTSTDQQFVVYYLGATANTPGPCCHSVSTWSGNRAVLAQQGWGFLPVYVGCQWQNGQCPLGCDISTVTTAQAAAKGQADANNAIALMTDEGFPAASYLFLDVEEGGILDPIFLSYITAWIQQINSDSHYWAGVYCHNAGMDQIKQATQGQVLQGYLVYLANSATSNEALPDPTTFDANASTVQYFWNATINYKTSAGESKQLGPVDFNSSIYTDPSTLKIG